MLLNGNSESYEILYSSSSEGYKLKVIEKNFV